MFKTDDQLLYEAFLEDRRQDYELELAVGQEIYDAYCEFVNFLTEGGYVN